MKPVIKTVFTQATISNPQNDSIHDDPITVTISDEGGGPFLLLAGPVDPEGGIRIDLEELEAVLVAARSMIEAAE